MGPRIREDNGRGWVPASARTTGGMGSRIREDTGGMGSRIREDTGGMGPRIPRGQREGMGSRIREDNGRGWVPASARTTEGWVPASARTTEGVGRAYTRDAPIGERGEEMG